MKKIYGYKIDIFYSAVVLCAAIVLFTAPFLHYPYDMFYHLIVIDDLYTQLIHSEEKLVGVFVNDIYFMVPTGEYVEIHLPRARALWHLFWAYLFVFFDIESTQLLLRAKIIHVMQIYISFFSIYYFSKVMLRNLFKKIEHQTLRWLSFWSVIIWFTVFATFSVVYQQVWILWYSVNYQITLPLFFYMSALSIVLLIEQRTLAIKLFYALQIILLARLIIQIHSMEFLYYLMYLLTLFFIYIDKVYIFMKRYFYLMFPMVFSIGYFVKKYQPEHSPLFNYLSIEKMPQLYDKIMEAGTLLQNGLNRASGSMNELIYLIGIMGVCFVVVLMWQRYKRVDIFINKHMLLFLFITSLFLLIPLYQFSGGLFALITHTFVVNRFYYSSSLFIVLPVIVYYMTVHYHLKLRYMHSALIVLLLGVWAYSAYVPTASHNYYRNITSIQRSFYPKEISFHLSEEEIAFIGEWLKRVEAQNVEKKVCYFARADIAFVIKYLYHRDVYWKGRRVNPDYQKAYQKALNRGDCKAVLFPIAKTFPEYTPYE